MAKFSFKNIINSIKEYNRPKDKSTEMYSVEFAIPPLPIFKEERSKDYVLYGDNNLYPQALRRILLQSPTQAAIIKSKSGMMAGDGFLIDGAKDQQSSKELLSKYPAAVQQDFLKFFFNANDGNDLEELHTLLCRDYQMYGAAAIEVVWSMDFTKISTMKYINVANIRSGKYVGGKIEGYYYSRDWQYYTKEGFIPFRIAAFDIKNKQEYNQLIYIKNGNLEYYGEPSYIECLSNIEVEGKISNFDLSSIVNGFAPSIQIKFYVKPENPEQKKQIVDGIKKQYAGTGNAGGAMVFFSDGKELAPDVLPIPVSDLDKQYTAIDERTTQKILTANQVVSPLLFGITTPGQLGGNTELETAYQIFNRSVMEPDRKKFERVYNKLLAINNIPITISIMPFNPLANLEGGNALANSLSSLSPLLANKILEVLTTDEVRDIVDLPPAVIPQAGATNSNII